VADLNLGAAAEQAALARFDLAMLGLYAGWSQNGYSIQGAAQALKTLKPSILVGNYSILSEAYYNTTRMLVRPTQRDELVAARCSRK